MTSEISKTQTARLLASFILHSNEKGEIKNERALFEEIGPLFSNGNVLEEHLYELSKEGIVYFEQIGEDGFAPIVMVGRTKHTADHLVKLIEEIDDDLHDLRRRLSDILTFDPERLKAEVTGAETLLKDARKTAEANELLRPLLSQISSIESHFHGVAVVAEKYEDVYKNIIRPVQREGESGVKATVRWAIISIVASTAISIVIGNWKDIVEIFRQSF